MNIAKSYDVKKNIKKKHFHKSSSKGSEQPREFVAKKKFGQNFLKDVVILEKIVESIPSHIAYKIQSREIRLIEIGIGLGDLTRKLIDKYSLLVYEIDTMLIKKAMQNFSQALVNNHLVIEWQDVLKLHKNDGYLFDSNYFLVSNLPYYIATPIILRILKDRKCCGFLVMTQKEVAQKFCANVMQKSFCALSVMAEYFGNIQYLFEVAPCCFVPKPKVYSAVFLFERIREKMPHDLEYLLKYAFSNPRKKLISNLFLHDIWDKQNIRSIFESLSLRDTIRPHEVSTIEYCKMAELMGNLHKG